MTTQATLDNALRHLAEALKKKHTSYGTLKPGLFLYHDDIGVTIGQYDAKGRASFPIGPGKKPRDLLHIMQFSTQLIEGTRGR